MIRLRLPRPGSAGTAMVGVRRGPGVGPRAAYCSTSSSSSSSSPSLHTARPCVKKLFLGIDPGMQGAAVLLRADGSLVASTKLPHVGSDLNLHDLTNWLEEACESEGAKPQQISAAFEALGNRPYLGRKAVRLLTSSLRWGNGPLRPGRFHTWRG